MSFCLEEVFEMACQIERDGAAFYRQAASVATTKEVRELFNELAEWEVRHEHAFRQLLDAIPQDRRTTYFDPDGEAAVYLDMMVEGAVFDARRGPVELPATVEGVFRTAVDKEKDSIVFYLGLKEAVPSGTDQVDRIISEEMRHISILARLAAKTGTLQEHGQAE